MEKACLPSQPEINLQLLQCFDTCIWVLSYVNVHAPAACVRIVQAGPCVRACACAQTTYLSAHIEYYAIVYVEIYVHIYLCVRLHLYRNIEDICMHSRLSLLTSGQHAQVQGGAPRQLYRKITTAFQVLDLTCLVDRTAGGFKEGKARRTPPIEQAVTLSTRFAYSDLRDRVTKGKGVKTYSATNPGCCHFTIKLSAASSCK